MPDCALRMGGELISTLVFHLSLSVRSLIKAILSLREGSQAARLVFYFYTHPCPLVVNVILNTRLGGSFGSCNTGTHWCSCVENGGSPMLRTWPGGDNPNHTGRSGCPHRIHLKVTGLHLFHLDVESEVPGTAKSHRLKANPAEASE